VERFFTPENLRQLQSWAADPHRMAETLTLLAPRYLTSNERFGIEEGLRGKAIAEAESSSTRPDEDENSKLLECISAFFKWTGLSLDSGIEVISRPASASAQPGPVPPRSDQSEAFGRAGQPVSTSQTSDNSNKATGSALPGQQASDNVDPSSSHGADATDPVKPPKRLVGKRAWTAVQAYARIVGGSGSGKEESKERDEHSVKLESWLPVPLDVIELTPRPWNVMRISGGTIEYVSHEPHSLQLRPGSEALAAILVTQGRSEMLGALKRAQNTDQRELQRQNLAQQVNKKQSRH
jgi:hypothetical protein